MRYASASLLTALLAHLKRLGVRPQEVATPEALALVNRRKADRIPAWLMVDVLERGAARLGDPLFGLRYAQQLDPRNYGPVSLLWRSAPTVRESNRISMRILHLQHEGLAVSIRDEEESSILSYRVDPELGRERQQFVESGVSLLLRVCRIIIGPTWIPQRVVFAHQPSADVSRYVEILNAPVKFGALETGIVALSSDLDRRSPDYDPDIFKFVQHSLIRLAERDPLPFRERLDQVVDDLLAIHKPHLAAAAAAMAISTRTLQRHLAAEGISFRDVVRHRRLLVIETWQQRSPKPSLGLLAEQTAFSEASAISRFLRRSKKAAISL